MMNFKVCNKLVNDGLHDKWRDSMAFEELKVFER